MELIPILKALAYFFIGFCIAYVWCRVKLVKYGEKSNFSSFAWITVWWPCVLGGGLLYLVWKYLWKWTKDARTWIKTTVDSAIDWCVLPKAPKLPKAPWCCEPTNNNGISPIMTCQPDCKTQAVPFNHNHHGCRTSCVEKRHE